MITLRSMALRRPLSQQLSRSTRNTVRLAKRPSWQRGTGRRGYASAHGGEHKEGSDLPWVLGAAITTVGGCGYILRNGPTGHAESPHGDDGGEHGGHQVDKEEVFKQTQGESDDKPDGGDKPDNSGERLGGEEEESADEGKKTDDEDDKSDDKEEKSDDKKEQKSDDKEEGKNKSESEDGTVTTQEAAEGTMKGPGKGVENDTRKVEEGGKGSRKRIDSALRKPQGEAGDQSKITNFQSKVSNAPTMHSTDQQNNPDQSKKSEGAPDTAKLPGTVDPFRKPSYGVYQKHLSLEQQEEEWASSIKSAAYDSVSTPCAM